LGETIKSRNSAFIEGLVEDALCIPLRGSELWEFVEETSGIWVTRLRDRMDEDRYKYDNEDKDTMKTKTPMKTMTMTSIPILSPQLE
jgi:hypothetical protein